MSLAKTVALWNRTVGRVAPWLSSDSLADVWQMRKFKEEGAELQGEDKWGNRYYQGNKEVFGQHRWIVYKNRKDPDPSLVPPEWHAWLNYLADETPQHNTLLTQPSFRKEHIQNPTFTSKRYMPPGSYYRKEKETYTEFESWEPKK